MAAGGGRHPGFQIGKLEGAAGGRLKLRRADFFGGRLVKMGQVGDQGKVATGVVAGLAGMVFFLVKVRMYDGYAINDMAVQKKGRTREIGEIHDHYQPCLAY